MTTYAVSSGHTSSGNSLGVGDFEYVSSGGSATATSVTGAELVVYAGGTDSRATVQGANFPTGANGTVLVSGGTDIGTTLLAGGDLSVYAGGTAISTTLLDYYNNESVYSGGQAISAVLGGGNLDIYFGGTGSDVTLGQYGFEVVFSGGTTISTTVNSAEDGDLAVNFGGTAIDSIVNDDSITVAGTAIGTTLNPGAYEYVASGGTASGTTVNSAGTQWVRAGGTTSNTKVNSGGTEVVYFAPANTGARAVGTTVNGGGVEFVYSGSTATGTTVQAGGVEFVSSGGTANVTTVNSGGDEIVDAGATASGTTVNSGGYLVMVPGSVQGATVLAGGTVVSTGVVVYLPNSGVTVYTQSATGILVEGPVDSNGDVVGSLGGVEIVLPGGTAIRTTIDIFGEVDVYGLASGTIMNNGALDIYSGGRAIGTTGGDTVHSGGVAVATTLNGASENVLAGGTASGSLVNGTGYQTVSQGGTTINTVVSGGQEYVDAGGTAIDTTVTTGAEWVESGGAATGTVLSSGGIENVEPGGSVNGITINAGGSAWLADGAVASGGIVFAGGNATLEVDSLSIPTISGFALTDTINLRAVSYDPSESSELLAGNVLQITDPNGDAQIQFDPTQNFVGAVFNLAYAVDNGYDGTYLTVTHLAPLTIGGTIAGQRVTAQTAIAPFTMATIADTNVGQNETVTITLSAAANGTLSNLGGFTLTTSPGVYTYTNTASNVTTALEGLIFNPTANQVPIGQTVTTTFTITDTDTAGDTTTDSTTTVVAGTLLPTITGTVAGQTTTDPETLTPFSKVTITDTNPGQTETVTVTLSAAANGTLSNLSGGGYNAATGVYTDTGTATAVTNALDDLVFTPTAYQVVSGESVTTTFTIKDTDTAGAGAADNKTTVGATEVGSTFTTLVSFSGTDGNVVDGNLIADANGDLFGTTLVGGSNQQGNVFEIVKTPRGYASTSTTLANFNNTTGFGTFGDLVADANGDLFGTTEYGGAYGFGTVYEIVKTASGYASSPIVLVSFNDGAIGRPQYDIASDSLIADASGNLFGTTTFGIASGYDGGAGSGTVFEIAKTASGYASTPTTLVSFNGTDGAGLFGGLIEDSNGDLFGTTEQGGAYGDGTVFEIVKTANGYASSPTTLLNFNGTDGSSPTGGLITDAEGDLFGTTASGGDNDGGTVFEIAKTVEGYASTPVTLADFGGSTDLEDPYASLLMDGKGDLFGIAGIYDPIGDSAVFEIASTANGYTGNPITLLNFTGNDYGTSGSVPFDSLIADAAGDVFGTTYQGGTGQYRDGTVFELSNSGYVVNSVSISGTAANQITSDRLSLSPFSTVVIADTGAGQTETITLTQSVVANGQLSNLGGFSSTGTPGVYTFTGTPSQITTALDGLVFAPTQNEVAAGQSVATTFTIQDSDTAGFTASDSKTTVVAAPPVTIQTNGVTTLVKIATQYALFDVGGSGPWLNYQGSAATVGEFGAGVVPVGAVKTTNGYEVAWGLGGDQFIIWNTDSNGNFTGNATGVLSGAGYALQSLETSFGEDLNNDGTIGPRITPIANNGTTALVQAANEYELNPSGGGSGPILQYQGSAATVGEFGAGVVPVGAVKTTNGYEVAWSLGANEFVVWNTDSSGNYLGAATGVLSGAGYALQSLETNFGEDLNNDGTIGPRITPIANNGTTALVQAANEYELNPSGGGSGPILQYQGSAAMVAEFGAGVVPVGAVKTTNGYEVAWDLGGDQFIVWNTDNNGNFTGDATGVVSGASYGLQSLETSFGEDLNNDGTIGPRITPIANNGTTALVQAANEYELNPSGGGSGPILQYQGSAATVGEFGAGVVPVGAVKTTNGYEVAWDLGGDQFIVWNTDNNGNFTGDATGVVSGASYGLQSLETSFGEDLNNDGTIGPRITPIANNGTTALVQAANEYELNPSGGGSGPILQYQGSAATVGEFGAGVVPVGAVKTTNGYEVAWDLGGDQFIVWNTDNNGNFTGDATGVVSGASYGLQSLETSFGEDLNNDGTIGPRITPIANNGTTALVQAANEYELNPSGGGSGPILQYQGSAATVGEFGAGVVPVGAVKTTNGYEVAWDLGGDQFIVWNTDNNGNFTGDATGVVSGASYGLQSLETSFGEDLNNDGTIGPRITPIANNGTTALVQAANEYELNPSGGGSGPILQYQGSAATVGEFGAGVVPVGAVKTTNGYEVAWDLGGDQFIVWNTDNNGNFTGDATGVVSGASYGLQSLETSFGEDLNNDGTIGPRITPIANNGTTALVQAANEYELNPSGGGSGPMLQYQDSAATVGEFGAGVVPVGAVKTTNGYEVAWSLGGDQFIVWNTDSNGNFTGDATGVLSGQSFALEDLEPTFREDLNGDGRLSAVLVISPGSGNVVNLAAQTQPTTINLGSNTASVSAALNAPSLSFLGTPDAITLGSAADIIEYAQLPSSGIETIANFVYGQDELNIDLQGAAPGLLQAYDTTVDGVHAIAIASSADLTHGVVLLNMTGGQTAANLLDDHTTFIGGHALIT